MAGAVALAAVFLVTTVEMVFTCGLCKGSEYHPSPEATAESGFATLATSEKQRDAANTEEQEDRTNEQVGGSGIAGLRRNRSHPLGVGLQKLTTSNTSPSLPPPPPPHPPSPPQPTPQQLRQKALLQVFLLELGILFHSVFIGMSLSVTTGSSFIVLLIAIIFHQTFEGLALGSRIAALEWSGDHTLQPWLMACAYGLTTPAGQAIGLGTHTLYSPQSETGLLVVGVMNAISSGLLLFAGLVELLAEDFLSDDSWRTLRGARRVWASAWVFLGAFGMALVGAWA
jgi:zinc transporter 1/2/3